MGKQREMGGQCGKKSRLEKEGSECRRNLGKEEVWKAEGKEERENGDALEAGAKPPEGRGPGVQLEEKRVA